MADFNSRYRNENHEKFYDHQNGADLKSQFYDHQNGVKNPFYDDHNGPGLKNPFYDNQKGGGLKNPFYDLQNGAGLENQFYDHQKGGGLRNEFYDRQNGTGLRNESNAVVPYQNPDAFKMFVSTVPPPVRKDEFPYRLPPVRKDKSESKSASMWCFNDPEMKRKRRVASYKSYSVEGKVKASFKKGYRWIKIKCSELIHGW